MRGEGPKNWRSTLRLNLLQLVLVTYIKSIYIIIGICCPKEDLVLFIVTPQKARYKVVKMQGLFKKMPSSVDFHFNSEHFGKDLTGDTKEKFSNLKQSIETFMIDTKNQNIILKIILDLIEETKDLKSSESFAILREMTSYLRIELLSNDPERVYNVIILIDVLINNSGFRMHILIGRRKFMKTFGLVLRRHLSHASSIPHQRVSYLAIDRLQAWGEAFTSRRTLYPHIYETYYKIIHKYHISFPRIYFDPARTPIRLGPITPEERQMVLDFPDESIEHQTKWEVCHLLC